MHFPTSFPLSRFSKLQAVLLQQQSFLQKCEAWMDFLSQTEQKLADEISGNYQSLVEQQRDHEVWRYKHTSVLWLFLSYQSLFLMCVCTLSHFRQKCSAGSRSSTRSSVMVTVCWTRDTWMTGEHTDTLCHSLIMNLWWAATTLTIWLCLNPQRRLQCEAGLALQSVAVHCEASSAEERHHWQPGPTVAELQGNGWEAAAVAPGSDPWPRRPAARRGSGSAAGQEPAGSTACELHWYRSSFHILGVKSLIYLCIVIIFH